MVKVPGNNIAVTYLVVGAILLLLSLIACPLVLKTFYVDTANDSISLNGDIWKSICSETDCVNIGGQGHSVATILLLQGIYRMTLPIYVIASIVLLVLSIFSILKGLLLLRNCQ